MIGAKKCFVKREVRLVRKWLIGGMAIIASVLIMTSFQTPLLKLLSLPQSNLLKLSKVTCDSLTTSEIDASCLKIDEYPTLLTVNQKFSLTVSDPKGNIVTEGFTYSSSQPQIASIDTRGLVSALLVGVTQINIKHTSGFSADFELKVEPGAEILVEEVKIKLLNTQTSITQGENFTISAKVTPLSLASSVSYSSSDSSIASIDNSGVIRAISPGKVTIKASVNGKSASFVLEVLKKVEVIKLQSLSITSASATMEIGTAQQLSISKSPANANEAIEYISSDSSVLSVSTSGKVVAKAVGTATITIRNTANTISDSVTIRVVNSFDIERLIKSVFELTNQERVYAGLNALTYNNILENGAMIRAEEIIGSFSHTRPDGSRFYTVFNDTYSFHLMGENLAAGFNSASAVVSGWMNSEGHRANILNEGYTQIGIGIAKDKDGRIYWVQIFADPK
jgi:uncharacterized protein YkwD